MEFDWTKTEKGNDINSEGVCSGREEMESSIRDLCIQLSSYTFDISDVEKYEKIIEIIVRYVRKHERLMYSVISNYVFVANDNIDNMVNNIDIILDYSYSTRFSSDMIEKFELEEAEIEKSRRIILKIHDHINLAIRQVEHFKFTDQKYQEKFDKAIKPVISREEQAMQTKMEGLTKDMTSQLVSLVGIFTAIAFIIFGSISEFNNIFSGLNDTSLLKLLMVGSVWGICLINLVYVFLFCIGKMTGLNFWSVQKSSEATIFQKYPIVWWSNLIVISILIVSAWLYFIIYRTNAVKELLNLLGTVGIVIVSIAIIAMIIVAVCFLYKKCNSESIKK